MRFLLQQGFGMMELNREFLGLHPGTGVILAPRACKRSQLERHAGEVRDLGGVVLFDPQFYEPRTDHPKIRNFEYWDGLDFQTSEFDASDFCERVVEYQLNVVGADELILPGRYTNVADENWRDLQASVADAAHVLGVHVPIYVTVAIGPDVVLSGRTFDMLLDEIINYPIRGIYLLLHHPRNHFLAQDELYLYSVLNGCLSLARAGKRLLLGYANQQSLLYAAAGVTQIASGNFRNVRHFSPDIFLRQEPDDRQRATWYYDASTLGEYRVQQLALQYQRGLRGRFGPACVYCQRLLEADNPASVPWGEPEAFRHFLHELRRQWMSLGTPGSTGLDRADAVLSLLSEAMARSRALDAEGFVAGERGFVGPVADATIGALEAYRRDRSSDLARLIPTDH